MQRQLGISLIEVLVSLVIVSIVLLGMMKLQITSLQHNQSAASVSQANLVAYDILERMRVNKGTDIAAYFNVKGVDKGCTIYSSSDAKPDCSVSDMALDDIYRWDTYIAEHLTNGKGVVCRSDLKNDLPGVPNCEGNDSDNPVVVYIWWTERESSELRQLAISGEF